MEYEIASREHRDPSGKLRRFHYDLLVEEVQAGRFRCEVYGIRIREEGGDSAVLPNLSADAREADRLMTLLVEHAVGPTGLQDIAAERQYAQLPRMA